MMNWQKKKETHTHNTQQHTTFGSKKKTKHTTSGHPGPPETAKVNARPGATAGNVAVQIMLAP